VGSPELVIMSEHNPRPLSFSSRAGLGMETGDGEASYARNSATLQGRMLRDTGHNLAEAIHQMSLPLESQPIRIADFGCSVGANTVAWADLATQSMLQSYRTKACSATSPPEIQYFFCDTPSNDFNTLFQELACKGETRPFFPAAVAGSFHEALLPKGSLHVAISTWSIHWMSKVMQIPQQSRGPTITIEF
jgi:gibberellin A4 carboxyl methyltransferase